MRGGTERTTPRLVELDGLRGVSLWLVLACHICFITGIDMGRYSPLIPMRTNQLTAGAQTALEAITGRGFIGVPIFFALSGFLLAGPFIRWRVCREAPVHTGAFLARRLARIQPPYLAAVAVSTTLILLGAPISGWNAAASAIYVHQPIFARANPVLVPAWSLEVEMQWYLVIPVVAVLLSSADRARRYLTAAMLSVAAIGFQIAVDSSSTRTDATVLSWLQFFLVGWVVCDLHQTAEWWKPSARRWDIVACFASLLLFFAAGRWSLQMTVAPLLIGALLIAALHGRITSRMMRTGWLVRSGRVSYSAFLVHFPLFLVVRRFVGPGPAMPFLVSFAFWAAVLLPLTFFVASGFHRWIEQPCLDGRFAMWIRTVATRGHDRWPTSRSRRYPLFVERSATRSGLARSAIPLVASRAIGFVRETDDR